LYAWHWFLLFFHSCTLHRVHSVHFFLFFPFMYAQTSQRPPPQTCTQKHMNEVGG
jgi:hypothetical protein